MEHSAVQQAVESGAKYQDLAWMVLCGPLIMALATTVFVRKDRSLSALLNIGGVALSFILSVTLLCIYGGESVGGSVFHWISLPGLELNIGLHLDRLATFMCVVVTGVASLVMTYSAGYMHEDRSYPRFFSTLSLFVFSMLGIVLADNLVMMFIFWELVGVSSYLLIGFWYERPAAGDAAKKAFLTNRLGDFGFMLGILALWSAGGTVNIAELQKIAVANPVFLGSLTTLAGLLIFMGAMGKSAQFPLHVWLPDAMEGPTPVSALIHAATMVAAGVYMLCRVFFLYTLPSAWPELLSVLNVISAATVISWIGGLTALLAAVIAVQQNDIKRILAYSTLSQLGLMVMAVGLGATGGDPSASMYHLVTHAFFKAMLFLGAGSVIHACHHEQDIWKMGGLRAKMPVTFWTFLIGTAALAGLPPFSGFYSKDEILATALTSNPFLFGVGVVVTVLTTFYMTRLLLVTFWGGARSESADHAHESPRVMTWPLIVLAVPSVMIAWTPIGEFLVKHFKPGHESHGGDILFGPFNHNPIAALFGFGAVIFGFSLAWSMYWGAKSDPLPDKLGMLARAMRNRFYFDEIYETLFVPLHNLIAIVSDWFDRWIIGGLGVRGVSGAVEVMGRALRLVQTGSLQTYTFLFAVGVVFIVYLALK
jgi:NADH-quinone oxidoreductase subunit L